MPRVDAWLSDARDTLARTAGVPPEELELGGEAVRTLLDLARIDAHESGDRTNAPLLCYLLGLCRAGGLSLDELAELVRSTS
jgi:hypothetical protein